MALGNQAIGPLVAGSPITLKTLAELRSDCESLGIAVVTNGRVSKKSLVAALRDYLWRQESLEIPPPPQNVPMLLASWDDLDSTQATAIEQDHHIWCIQPKLDGVRALLHVETNGIRVTGRAISEVTYRLSEFQANLPHLTSGFVHLDGTILDGELVSPVPEVDTGHTITSHPLQAAVAVLATSPEKARLIQDRHRSHLRFHAFDILAHNGRDVTSLPLRERLEFLRQAVEASENPHLESVPTCVVGKPAVHRRIIGAGGEGTVWKRLDSPYEPGRRVKHWIKRKSKVSVEAVVTSFKSGTPGKGHEHLVGGLEFSRPHGDGPASSVAWVTAFSDEERRAMTRLDPTGRPQLSPDYLGRTALITGQGHAARSGRLRHARLVRWL